MSHCKGKCKPIKKFSRSYGLDQIKLCTICDAYVMSKFEWRCDCCNEKLRSKSSRNRYRAGIKIKYIE